ncbi:MAG TPA: hypothetical protein VMT00_14700 [Thermoanaerobaculia bacterium]|nr:hypothetical protein [Thermoanaerobaculia bacterium]
MRRFIPVASLIVVIGVAAFGEETDHSGHAHHAAHAKEVDQRGDTAMGFSHAKTEHHFRLRDDGGTIEATAKDAADGESIEQIRQHFREIAAAFAAGDFDKPQFIHGETPPGVAVMKRLKGAIRYRYEERELGGIVSISTSDREALEAIHEFLRFQIADHRTGDAVEIE